MQRAGFYYDSIVFIHQPQPFHVTAEMLRYVWHSHYPLSSETIKKDAIDIRLSSAGAISALSHAVDYRVREKKREKKP